VSLIEPHAQADGEQPAVTLVPDIDPEADSPGSARQWHTAALYRRRRRDRPLELSSIPEAIADFAAGRYLVIVDDESRENEGDLCVAAEHVSPRHVAFMARHASGLICTAMTGERLDALGIGPAVARNTSNFETAFTVSVEAACGTTTGISAADRATTIRELVNPSAVASDFVQPGHTFPIRARPGGVLERPGHTEAVVDLARLAGLQPAGVICEIMNDDGTMARAGDLGTFSDEHGVRAISIKDLIAYRRRHEKLVQRIASCALPVAGTTWEITMFENVVTGEPYTALVLGDAADGRPVLVRAHSSCLTGDVFGSERCDCGPQLQEAMERIAAEGRGIVLYFGGHEGRGIGLVDKVRAYRLQQDGLDTVEANLALHAPVDNREYGSGASILAELGATRVRLLTNNPRKIAGMQCHGVEVVERIPLTRGRTEHNIAYLCAKRDKLGHLI
jgi:3,4-dihydroxy 2-butanone 4-phosphate synthase/GTP cyclohydrolase II